MNIASLRGETMKGQIIGSGMLAQDGGTTVGIYRLHRWATGYDAHQRHMGLPVTALIIIVAGLAIYLWFVFFPSARARDKAEKSESAGTIYKLEQRSTEKDDRADPPG